MVAIEIGQIVQDFAVIMIVSSVMALLSYKLRQPIFSARAQGFSTLTALRTGFGLSSSGGELALVVAKGGTDIGVTSSFILPMVGAMTVITTFITPYMIKFGWRFSEIIASKSPTSLSQYFDIQKRLSKFRIFKKDNRK